MKMSLDPARERDSRTSARGVLLLLALSVGALVSAPLLMPEGYSWIVHTTSESAAQGLEGAWLARLGFLTFGLAVVWLSAALDRAWARGVVWLHLAFGVLMISTAVFSHQPWVAGVSFDPVEDGLHSFTATAMGFAFALGVLLRLFQRRGQNRLGRVLDITALVSATVIPLLMLYQSGVAGLVQRLMFLVAYAWYGTEAVMMGAEATAQQRRSAGRHPDQMRSAVRDGGGTSA